MKKKLEGIIFLFCCSEFIVKSFFLLHLSVERILYSIGWDEEPVLQKSVFHNLKSHQTIAV